MKTFQQQHEQLRQEAIGVVEGYVKEYSFADILGYTMAHVKAGIFYCAEMYDGDFNLRDSVIFAIADHINGLEK